MLACQHCLVTIIGFMTWVSSILMVKSAQIPYSKRFPACIDFGLLGAEILCMHISDGLVPGDRLNSMSPNPKKKEGEEACV